jgi:hypothetical protein
MDWEAVHGIMEDAIYGGRVDNAYDLRVLRAYLRYYLNFVFEIWKILIVYSQCIFLRPSCF